MGWVCGVTRWAWDGVGMWSDQVVVGWEGGVEGWVGMGWGGCLE